MDSRLSKCQEMHANMKDQKSRLLYAVNALAEILLTADEGNFESSLREGMELVACCLEIDRIYIWQNEVVNGSLMYVQQLEWLRNSDTESETVSSRAGFSYTESIPEWEEKFLRGECVNGPLKTLSQTEQERLKPYNIQSILVIPVHLRNFFWGFVSFDDCHTERTFTDDEVSILRSANLMMATTMDRHQTAARMRETDEHARLMLDAMPLCCSLWDWNRNLVNCNAEAVSFFGLNSKQEYIDGFYELSPEFQPDGSISKQKSIEYIDLAFREGSTVFEWMHQMPDGTPVPVEVTIVRVRRGDGYIVAGYTRDLRDQKRMIQDIEYSNILLHTVNDVAGILLQSETDTFDNDLHRCLGMIAESVFADRMYIWENHEKDGKMYCTQLYEWSGSVMSQQGGAYAVDIPGEGFADWYQKLSEGQCINGIVRCFAAQEQAHLSPQGILSILLLPVFLRDKFWGFIGLDDCHRERVFTSQVESILRSASLLIANALLRNQMTHEIRAAIEQAQAASKAKSAFLARMSHEIRTPMNVIAGMTELVLREDIPESIYEYVHNIQYASSNMLSLVKDVLDFSKIEAGSLDIVAAEYSLTSLINNVINTIRMKIIEKPVYFTANIDCDIPNRLIGDETRIRQILLNVLDNAAKYTAEGFISLTIHGEIEDDTVVLTAEVTDSGVGIKQENIETLFDDFIRFDTERNKGVQGTGLGLAITKNLCQAMGGSVFVRSEYGVGSTFTITIPQKIKSLDERFASVKDPDAKRVLLYETRPQYVDSIVRTFKNLGVCFALAKTPKDFYEKLKSGIYAYAFVATMLSETASKMVEELKPNTKLVLLAEYGEAPAMRGIRAMAMPIHAASIANILEDVEDGAYYNENGRDVACFVAPTAIILVVDDLNTNLKVARGLLVPYQMQVDICEDGEEAVRCVQNKRYDLIFMDHMMPGIDGIEATKRIRSLDDGSGYFQSVPIIALTANAVSGVKDMFLQNGMNDFLAKPIDIAKLHSLLDKWIPASKKKKALAAVKERRSVNANASLIKIEGVDVQAGIGMTGGKIDGYIKTLFSFHADVTERIIKIRDCVEKSDFKHYTIHVHALKSASASIGAWEISEIFRQLEIAGAREDAAFIRKNTEHSLAGLGKLLSNIHAAVSGNRGSTAPQNDPEVIKNELLKLKKALNERDAGAVDDVMEILQTVRWNRHADAVFAEMSRKILLIDYPDAAVLADELLAII